MKPATRELMRSLQIFQKKISRVQVSEELTPVEFGAMSIIDQKSQEASGKRVKVSDISDGCRTSKPMMSKILGELERQGYIQREESEEDRRVACITLTGAGEEALRRATEEYDRFADWILERLGEENARVLKGLVDRFSEILAGQEECPWREERQ